MAVERGPLTLTIKDRRSSGKRVSEVIASDLKINHPIPDDLFQSVEIIQTIKDDDNQVNKSIIFGDDGKFKKLFINGIEVACTDKDLGVVYTDSVRDTAVVAIGEKKKEKLISLIQGQKVEQVGFGYNPQVFEQEERLFLFKHKKVKGKTNTMFRDILDSAGNWKFVERNVQVGSIDILEQDRIIWRGHEMKNYTHAVLYDGEKFIAGGDSISGPYLDSEKKHYLAFVESEFLGLTLKKEGRGFRRYSNVIYDGSAIATVIDATTSYVAKDLKYAVVPRYNKKSKEYGLTLVKPNGTVTKFGPYSSLRSRTLKDYRMSFDVTENKIGRILEFNMEEEKVETKEQSVPSA